MPTFTAIALERLLEPKTASSHLKHHQQINNNNKTNFNTNTNNDTDTKRPVPNHIYISPALYTTPEPAPIPYTCTESISPSPYVVNRKRRDPPVPEAVNRLDGFEIRPASPVGEEKDLLGGLLMNGDVDDDDDKISGNRIGELNNVDLPVDATQLLDERRMSNLGIGLGGEGDELLEEGDLVKESEEDEFFVPRDSMSVTSSTSAYAKSSQHLTQSEFFDADEEFFSDGSISNASPKYSTNIIELHAIRVKLFEEMERRKRAEEALGRMRSQWQGIYKHLCHAELSYPAAQDGGDDSPREMDSVDQLCQEVVVTRVVSEEIGRALARAECEEAAESLVEAKNMEISRLKDRLQYYEAVNREMFERNQEVVERARAQRRKRKTKQRWIWSCIGLSITIGASVLAYSYLSESSGGHVSEPSVDSSDSSPATMEPTSIDG